MAVSRKLLQKYGAAILAVDPLPLVELKSPAWSADLFAKSNHLRLALPVPAEVTHGAKLVAEFAYTTGNSALQIESVSLEVDDKAVASDEHVGWTGLENRNNRFTLALPRRRAPRRSWCSLPGSNPWAAPTATACSSSPPSKPFPPLRRPPRPACLMAPMALSRTATVDTAFQRVEVWKSEQQVEFRVAGAIHAWWQRDRFLTGLAWDNLAAAALLRPAGPPRSILMLGLAGGTAFRILRHLLPDVELVAVDIDTEIIALAREHMHLDEIGIEIHLGDAYAWLTKNKRRFDVVIDDVYLAGKSDVFRPHAWNPQHLDTLRRAVAPGGLFAANLVTGAGHRVMQSHSRRALMEAFPVVRSVTTPQSLNETLVAGDDVLSGRSLRTWEPLFPQRRDRALWDILRVRKL